MNILVKILEQHCEKADTDTLTSSGNSLYIPSLAFYFSMEFPICWNFTGTSEYFGATTKQCNPMLSGRC